MDNHAGSPVVHRPFAIDDHHILNHAGQHVDRSDLHAGADDQDKLRSFDLIDRLVKIRSHAFAEKNHIGLQGAANFPGLRRRPLWR